MYLTGAFLDYINAFTQWGFLMAFLYCLVSSVNIKNKSLLITSSIMLCSYFLSGYFTILNAPYLDWILYDFLTIVAILFFIKIDFIKCCPSANFILIGLVINSLLASVMHYDLYILYHLDEWWYWSFYSVGSTLIDVLMMLSLILNKNLIKMSPLKIINLNKKNLKNNE